MSKFRQLKEWKGLQVKIEKVGRTPTVNAKYNKKTQTITLYDHFFTKDELRQEAILEHEYAHHIFNSMPIIYRQIVSAIHKWLLMKQLIIFWAIPETVKKDYITKYAQKNYSEDFAENVEAKFLIDNWVTFEMTPFVKFKYKVFNSIFNYYDKKFGNK